MKVNKVIEVPEGTMCYDELSDKECDSYNTWGKTCMEGLHEFTKLEKDRFGNILKPAMCLNLKEVKND